MHNGRKLLHWFTLLVCVVTLVCAPALALASPKDDKGGKKPQPEIVRIDEMSAMKQLEMPPAVFPHDKHTREVAKRGQSCGVCHLSMSGETAFTYKNLPGTLLPKQAEDRFHAGCIGCHTQWNDGPQAGECRVCHAEKPATSQLPVPFDKSLHAIHIQSRDVVYADDPAKNCGACHHSYDETQKKLVWIPGTEEACSVCHAAKAVGNTPSLKDASHQSCVACHVETAKKWDSAAQAKAEKAEKPEPPAKPEKAEKPAKPGKDEKKHKKADAGVPQAFKGPVTCSGCHSLEGQAEFPKLAEVPRLMRGQPDVTLIVPVNNPGTPAAGMSMSPVVFDHKSHEAATTSCNVCHHVRIAENGCVQCHTVQGTPESQGVTLFTAMHAPDSRTSCVGCHEQTILQDKNCAGCHVLVKPTAKGSEASCAVCHAKVEGLPASKDGKPVVMSKTELAAIGQKNLELRKPATPLSPEDVPETVTIGAIAKEYEAVNFPHRKIYKALLDGTAESRMAAAFHATPETTCGACHHNVPAANLTQPPKCITCHDNTGNVAAPGKLLPLKAAYHQQCMACHERMNVKPVATDCAGCHAQRPVKPATAKAGR